MLGVAPQLNRLDDIPQAGGLVGTGCDDSLAIGSEDPHDDSPLVATQDAIGGGLSHDIPREPMSTQTDESPQPQHISKSQARPTVHQQHSLETGGHPAVWL